MQLDLFQSGSPAPVGRDVEPAPADPATAALARGLPAALRLGTSSWAFPGWRGLVYRDRHDERTLARLGLAAYADHPLLRAVSLDRTYYAPLDAADYAAYARQVPDDFRFMVKAPMACTAASLGRGRPEKNPYFLDAGFCAAAFVEPCLAGLGPKAGVLLLQLPPLGLALRERARLVERLAAFLSALPRGVVYAVEPRDAALLGADYAGALAAGGARHCVGIHPRMPPVAEQVALLDRIGRGPLVVRWNLGGGLDYEQARSRYRPFDRVIDADPGTREAVATACTAALRAGQEALVIANNKAEGSAPCTLGLLAGSIERRLSR